MCGGGDGVRDHMCELSMCMKCVCVHVRVCVREVEAARYAHGWLRVYLEFVPR